MFDTVVRQLNRSFRSRLLRPRQSRIAASNFAGPVRDRFRLEELESRTTPALFVDLTYPNTGSFAIGQVIHITGTASDSSGINHTAYELYKGGNSAGNFVGTIFQGANGSGLTSSFNWTVPTTLGGQSIGGTDYTIKMVAWANSPPTNSAGDFSTGNLTLQLSTARVTGIDVSHWQGTINWTQVNAAGVAFSFMKATEGINYFDPTFTTNAAGSQQAGVMPGAYHYARPDLGNSAVAEANWFVNHASAVIGPGFLPPVVDVEGLALNLPSATLSTWVDAYLDQVQQLTGIRPLLYASQGFLTYINQDPTQTGLWVARYNGQDPQTGSPGNVSPWPTSGWKVWQYSSSGVVSGISGNVDMDVFNGTYAAMYSWLNSVWDTTAPKVVGVYFDGSAWPAAFRTAAGNATHGYPAKTSGNQLTSLPWNTVNTVTVKFSENVTADSADLGVRGIAVANYPIASFSYDSVNFVAKWVLSGNIDTDRIILDLDGDSASAVVDLAGNKLAGNWTESVSTFPTSGAAATDFKYRFVVAVGDADRNGILRNPDTNLVRANLFTDIGQAGYDIYRDIDGNGQTRNADLNAVRSHLFVDPPAGPGPNRPGLSRGRGTGIGLWRAGSVSDRRALDSRNVDIERKLRNRDATALSSPQETVPEVVRGTPIRIRRSTPASAHAALDEFFASM